MNINNEEFKPVGFTKLDVKKRVTLGKFLKKTVVFKNISISDFETFIGNNGDILLRPRTAIPATELWVNQEPAVLRSMSRAFKDAKEGKTTRVKNIDKFFNEL